MKKPIFDKYLFIWMQCAEFLKSKLPGWEEICSDATKVPEKVRMMIDEIRTPGSTPVSGTPQPSPMVKRNPLVCCSSWLWALLAVEWLQEVLFDLSIWDGLHSVQLEYTGLYHQAEALLWGKYTAEKGGAHVQTRLSSQLGAQGFCCRAQPQGCFGPAIPFPTFLSVSNSNYILSSSIWT